MGSIKKSMLSLILLSSLYIQPINSVITFFLQPYPTVAKPLNEERIKKYSHKLQQPGYLFKKIVKGTRVATGSDGVMSTYLGFVSTSDLNGKVTFPRKHQKATVNLLVTKGIKPVFIVAPDTLNNWMLDESEQAAMYNFTLHHDAETELFYIEATTAPLPKNKMIPLETIIIIADPKNVFVPQGATITDYSVNLILPNIYIKKHFNFSYNALYTLSIKQYFGSINQEYKQEKQTISMILQQ